MMWRERSTYRGSAQTARRLSGSQLTRHLSERALRGRTYHRPIRGPDFERLFTEHAQPLFAFLLYRTGDRELSEDLVAGTFERALRARRRLDLRRGTEKAWLYAIALNLLRDHGRRQAAEGRALERLRPVDLPDEDTPLADLLSARDQVMRALASLTAEEREALSLRFGADLTIKEIAQVLGQPVTTVEGRVYRGLRKLEQFLAAQE